MDHAQPTPQLRHAEEPLSGIQSWRPYQSTQACCDPIAHIRAENLSIAYHDHLALQHVNLQINKGCITALVGPSGCGKTSFLMSLNRLTDLVPGCRVSGHLQIDGLDVLAPTTDLLHLRRQVGMIFQKPTVFPFSIKKNLELPLREHGKHARETWAAMIATTLQRVGFWDEVKDRLNQPAQALSGGQQQRLCLARALILSPEVLLLDEPCSALDPISSGIVEDLIMSLRGRYTVIIVTHNLAQARRMADHVALFWSVNGIGQLIETGSAQSLFESPQHELTAAYISGARG
ncbi:MAG: phosphate ABC transporter ATP-binding protein [Nitrospirales bacterium]|nr:MAG: phosphate ABC transporter ATP-binding protein [Nitrospirales bacterium]